VVGDVADATVFHTLATVEHGGDDAPVVYGARLITR
jgi:hypothetical protein